MEELKSVSIGYAQIYQVLNKKAVDGTQSYWYGSFHEDASRIHKDHSADNLAVIRHFALNALFFLDVGKKNVSARRKRKKCGRNPQLLLLALDKIPSSKPAP